MNDLVRSVLAKILGCRSLPGHIGAQDSILKQLLQILPKDPNHPFSFCTHAEDHRRTEKVLKWMNGRTSKTAIRADTLRGFVLFACGDFDAQVPSDMILRLVNHPEVLRAFEIDNEGSSELRSRLAQLGLPVSSNGAVTPTHAHGENRPLGDTLDDLDDAGWRTVIAAAKVIFRFCQIDQIESTGAWGKGAVRVIEGARGYCLPQHLREEGSVSPTAEMVPLLLQLSEIPIWRNEALLMATRAVEYLVTRWDPRNGFSRRNDRLDGSPFIERSVRHTAVGTWALLHTGHPDHVRTAMQGARLLVDLFPDWLSGCEPDPCPSAAAAYLMNVFHLLQCSHYRHLMRDYPDIASFLKEWKKIRRDCHGKIALARQAYRRGPWLPPYADSETLTYRSVAQLLRYLPPRYVGEFADVSIPALMAVCDDIDEWGLSLAPRTRSAYDTDECFESAASFRAPDFGTTCSFIGVLARPAVHQLLTRYGYKEQASEWRKCLLGGLRRMLEEPCADYFRWLWNGPASSVLELAHHPKAMSALGQANRVISPGPSINSDAVADEQEQLPDSVMAFVRRTATFDP